MFSLIWLLAVNILAQNDIFDSFFVTAMLCFCLAYCMLLDFLVVAIVAHYVNVVTYKSKLYKCECRKNKIL